MNLMNFSDRETLLYLILPGLFCLCKAGFLAESQEERKKKGGGWRGGGYVEEKELCVFGRGGW